jgi:hypothetical protein
VDVVPPTIIAVNIVKTDSILGYNSQLSTPFDDGLINLLESYDDSIGILYEIRKCRTLQFDTRRIENGIGKDPYDLLSKKHIFGKRWRCHSYLHYLGAPFASVGPYFKRPL